MSVTVTRLDRHGLDDARCIDGSFVIDSRLVVHAEDDAIRTTLVRVPPRVKRYPSSNYARYVAKKDRIAFLARVGGKPAGVVAVYKPWSGYGGISEILVDADHRRRGVGNALMAKAVEWARTEGLPGLMLETQNTNVAACRFYERCGFILKGFDRCLYSAIDPDTDETALFWYLFFDRPPQEYT